MNRQRVYALRGFRPVALVVGTALTLASRPGAAQNASSTGGATATTVVPRPNAVVSEIPPPTGPFLTLVEAVTAARLNAPSVLAAIAQARVVEAQIRLARTPLMPVIGGSSGGSISANNGNAVNSQTGMPVNLAFVSMAADISLSARWTIWDFGATSARVAAVTENARGALNDARNVERVAMLQAAAAYMTLLADQELVAASIETVRQRERQLEIASGLVAAGARAPIEQTRAEVALGSARLELTVAQVRTLTDGAQLAGALAMDPAGGLQVARPRELVLDDDPGRAAAAALRSRPEIVAAQARLAAAEFQLSAVRRTYLPTVSTNASGSFRYTERLGAQGGFSESGAANIGLTVPIFDASISANVRIAEASIAVQRAQLAQQMLVVRTDAVVAAIAVHGARQTLAQSEQVAIGAAANLQQAEGRYAAGVASLLELVDAQAADATARVNVIRARLQLELAKVQLLAAMGLVNTLAGAR